MTMAETLREKVYKDWLKIAESVVRKRGKQISDLAFAKRTNTGYAFFESIHHEGLDMLHEIAQKIHDLYPHYQFSFVVELCSELANNDGEHLSSHELAI